MRLRLLALFTAIFGVVYGSADLLTSLHPWRWPMATPGWPFWPDWAAMYLSLNLLIPVAFWKTPSPRLGALTLSLLGCTVAAWPLFLLFPLEAIPLPQKTTLSPALWLADRLNLSANYFPSLHVAYALVCAAFLARPWSWCWGLVIAFSTLVTHQHYTIDVIGGAALAHLLTSWARGRGRVEGECLSELARCATRHRRYAVIAAALYAVSVLHPRRRRLARVGFCYLQRLDDLLDGHLHTTDEPAEIATAHQQALRGQRPFDDDGFGLLGQTMRQELEQRGQGLEWAVQVIEEMKLDRRRVREQLLLEEPELDSHHQRTFELSLNLMLVAADSSLRSDKIPSLVQALGWCSVVRDLHEDQALGLINIPRNHWLAGTSKDWLSARHVAALDHLRRARIELEALVGQPGQRLLKVFLSSIERYAAREARWQSRGSSPP